ncbi:MAG: lytic transglycosylase domain-containing protein [Deltaproteobacteria bacterium]|nr:lytic transglycosylase domain-containing protein [Deltaproteobacteria bacterium]
MQTRIGRISAVFLVAVLSLLPYGEAIPGEERASWRPSPPEASELASLKGLAQWVGSTPNQKVKLPKNLRSAIADQSEGFDLFRRFGNPEDQRSRLASLPFGDEIYRVARQYDLDGLLLAALVEAESNFSPTAVSPVGAVGLTQVMPATAGTDDLAELENPHTNLRIGARYLRDLLRRFEGNVEFALAAYNAGPSRVERFEGIPPYRETRRYVEKVLAIYVGHHQSLWEGRATASELLLHGASRNAGSEG